MVTKKRKRGRPKGSKTKKRLHPPEQVLERLDSDNGVGFAAGLAVYQPIANLTPYQIRDLILTCGWIDDCINTITEDVVKNKLYTQGIDGKPHKEISAFLKYPSEVDPLFIIRKKVIKDMLRYGNGACVIAYKNGKPSALQPIPGYTLRVTNNNPPKYKLADLKGGKYKKNKDGKDMVFSSHEMMHFQMDANSDSTVAKTPLERVYDLIISDKNLSKSLSEFTSRGFFKPAFISIEGGTKKEITDYVEYLNQMVLEGAKMFGMNKKATIAAIPYWTAEEIINAQKWIGLRVANAYKVPPFMLNLVADVGSLSAREQRARFSENVILPILEYEGYIYTMKLALLGFKQRDVAITAPTMHLKLNYNTVRAANLMIGKDESILTVDEARKFYLGLDPKKEIKSKTE